MMKTQKNWEVFRRIMLKKNKFEKHYSCFFGGDYQKEWDNYVYCSTNHEMYHQ